MANRNANVLVLEDDADWFDPMLLALKDCLNSTSTHSNLAIDIRVDHAEDTLRAARLLRAAPWRLASFDVRLPRGPREGVSVQAGIDFLNRPSATSALAKRLVYSATLMREGDAARMGDAATTPRQRIAVARHDEVFSKGPSDHAPQLTMRQWSELVTAYLISDELRLPRYAIADLDLDGGGQTVLGRWFEQAPRRLPPLLARLSVPLAQAWLQRLEHPQLVIDAAIPFIEATSMMALAQTAMLCRAAVDQSQRDAAEIQIHDAWPQSEGQTGVLKALKRLRHGLSLASRQCNWLGWLHVDALTAFQVANDLRNRLRHDLKPRDHYTDLQALRAPLQCAMDVAGYWAMHPLCFEVRAAPGGGWQAQCFVSRGMPNPMEAIDDDLRMPPDLAHRPGTVWQSAGWRDADDQDWDMRLEPWAGTVERGDDFSLWFTAWRSRSDQAQPVEGRIDLLTGQYQTRAVPKP